MPRVVHDCDIGRVGDVHRLDASANLEQFGGKVRYAAGAPGRAYAVIMSSAQLIEVWWLPSDRTLVSMEWSYVDGILPHRLPSGILGCFVVVGGWPRVFCSSRNADLADPNWG